MGTQGAGRKRSTNKDKTTAEDDALNLIAREAEARLAAKRAARAEAREIRMKELERQQKELSDEDERMSVGSRGSVRVEDGNYLEKGSRAASALTATTLTSLGGTSSRRGSGETALTLDAETSIREIKEIHELKDQIQDVESKFNQNLKEAKDKLAEVEEKYRKAMVSNAQLDNEKNNLMYQVDTLKDSLMELEEQLAESRREYEDKAKDFEREKHAHTVLQFQFNELKETLKQSEELLNKHGIVLGPDLNINGGVTEALNTENSSSDPNSQPTQETPISPTEGTNSMLEIRLRKLVDEREKMIEQVKNLKAQLEQKTQKNGTDNLSPDGEIVENGNDPALIEMQRDASRQMNDLKFKLVKAEQEATALEQNVTRLEGQVARYKSAAENSEKVEDELKAEKRKLQRELRSALDKIDELESNNNHLSKRLEKMKTSRGMAPTP
ncbi:leucine-rich repeat flightless-interacting protein 2-like isoform X4 [Boleophthalmus pectinirostris]|uniref:leucine-rich repeat flightless-interacting protein 2-like isoform X4 n=1 Tax=Boleophthalmus pectinirostris TaxID=150288 RepID=UPI00242F1061|nr:leucine-rich repeat flightless-interacting protein 2-like isoform X4 [Boleophthalmus pectinirostris]